MVQWRSAAGPTTNSAGLRRIGAGVAVLTFAVLAVLVAPPVAAQPQQWPLTPDQQAYATAWGADPYQNEDLHVAVTAGWTQAVSFLFFDLDQLPAGATIIGFDAILAPNENAHQNVGDNAGTPVVACPGTGEFPAEFDPMAEDVPWDCSTVSVAVETGGEGVWSVDLLPLVGEWQRSANTGVVLVATPSFGGSSESWVVSFDRRKTSGTVVYTLPESTLALPAVAAPAPPPQRAVPMAQAASESTYVEASFTELASSVSASPAQPVAQAPVDGSSASSPPLSFYAFIALWSVCAALLVVGIAMKLRTAEGSSPRALGAAVSRTLRQKSTWIAGIPLLLVVGPVGGVIGYAQYLNTKVTPPLTFSDVSSAPAASAPSSGDSVAGTSASAPSASALSASAPSETSAVSQQSADDPRPFDGRWVVAAGSVGGYTMSYSSPMGNGVRVGRTNGTDGVTGELTIVDNTVRTAKFAIEMELVACDGGQACTDHINEMMDTANHPFETFVLSTPIEVPAVLAEGEQITRSVTGELTLRGVTRTPTFTLTGRHRQGRIEVLGTIPVNRADYGIPDADRPGFSVAEDGTIDILFVFERAS